MIHLLFIVDYSSRFFIVDVQQLQVHYTDSPIRKWLQRKEKV